MVILEKEKKVQLPSATYLLRLPGIACLCSLAPMVLVSTFGIIIAVSLFDDIYFEFDRSKSK